MITSIYVVFWIIKIAATTLGETAGDSVTMTQNWGYLAGTALFLGFLAVLVIAQILAKRFHPFLYWATIIASTTFGTTMADFADRSLTYETSFKAITSKSLTLSILYVTNGLLIRSLYCATHIRSRAY